MNKIPESTVLANIRENPRPGLFCSTLLQLGNPVGPHQGRALEGRFFSLLANGWQSGAHVKIITNKKTKSVTWDAATAPDKLLMQQVQPQQNINDLQAVLDALICLRNTVR